MIHNWSFRSNFLLSLFSFQVKISTSPTLLSQAASMPFTTSVNIQCKEHCSADTSSWQAGARGSCCALQSGLKPLAILLPQLLKCWDLPVWVTTAALKSGSYINCQGQEQCFKHCSQVGLHASRADRRTLSQAYVPCSQALPWHAQQSHSYRRNFWIWAEPLLTFGNVSPKKLSCDFHLKLAPAAYLRFL